ncbi:MAG: hypothetical protein VX908_07110, partial [Planctomycetota bacterium]|nr:hypothetical protein [Planctomycetota bacterium]
KRNPSYIWFMEGGRVLERGELPAEMSLGWRVVGAADFDNDGADELYWFNEFNRLTQIWDLQYVQGDSDAWISAKTDRSRLWNMGWSWQPMAILESSESTSPSIFWYAHEGKIGSVRKRNPNNIDQTTYVQPLFDVDGNAIIAGPAFWPRVSGDFDADGLRDDMLWQSVEDGRIAIWLMDGPLVLDVIIVTYQGGGEPVIAWEPVGVGNFSSNSESDHTSIFWQCGGANKSWIWSMDQATTSSDLGSFVDLFLGSSTSGGSSDGATDVADVYTISIRGTNFRLANVSVFNEDDGGDGSDSGDYDINQFDPNNPSTWPDGITNPIAMIGWLTVNVTADDPSSWPDSVNSEEELTVWLAQQVAALSGI